MSGVDQSYPRHIHAYLDGICLTCNKPCEHDFESTPLVHAHLRTSGVCLHAGIAQWGSGDRYGIGT